MSEKTLCTVLVSGLFGSEAVAAGDTVELDPARAKTLIARGHVVVGKVKVPSELAGKTPGQLETADKVPATEQRDKTPARKRTPGKK